LKPKFSILSVMVDMLGRKPSTRGAWRIAPRCWS